jgi:hypothetical protein
VSKESAVDVKVEKSSEERVHDDASNSDEPVADGTTLGNSEEVLAKVEDVE